MTNLECNIRVALSNLNLDRWENFHNESTEIDNLDSRFQPLNIIELLQKLDEVSIDAARYRWIRDHLPWTLISSQDVTKLSVSIKGSVSQSISGSENDLDEIIDGNMLEK